MLIMNKNDKIDLKYKVLSTNEYPVKIILPLCNP